MSEQHADSAALPEWADEWTRGRCGCGARLVKVYGYAGVHVVCSASGWAVEACDLSQPDGDAAL